jgi:hypothetical protein
MVLSRWIGFLDPIAMSKGKSKGLKCAEGVYLVNGIDS